MDGHEAVDILERESFDVMLLDAAPGPSLISLPIPAT
jgi:hypothetical protein